jgi:hypothetical protein
VFVPVPEKRRKRRVSSFPETWEKLPAGVAKNLLTPAVPSGLLFNFTLLFQDVPIFPYRSGHSPERKSCRFFIFNLSGILTA